MTTRNVARPKMKYSSILDTTDSTVLSVTMIYAWLAPTDSSASNKMVMTLLTDVSNVCCISKLHFHIS